jgi:hypothetical protein
MIVVRDVGIMSLIHYEMNTRINTRINKYIKKLSITAIKKFNKGTIIYLMTHSCSDEIFLIILSVL